MGSQKKSQQRRKLLSKQTMASQRASGRAPELFTADSKQQPAPKPDIRTLQQQLQEAREHVTQADAQVAAAMQQQQQAAAAAEASNTQLQQQLSGAAQHAAHATEQLASTQQQLAISQEQQRVQRERVEVLQEHVLELEHAAQRVQELEEVPVRA